MKSPIRPFLISVYLLKYALTLTVCTSTGARRQRDAPTITSGNKKQNGEKQCYLKLTLYNSQD